MTCQIMEMTVITDFLFPLNDHKRGNYMANADIWKWDSYLFTEGSPHFAWSKSSFFVHCFYNKFALSYHGTLQNEDSVPI